MTAEAVNMKKMSSAADELQTVPDISFHVEKYNRNTEKRNYNKTDYCLYCKNKYTSKISKHLFAVHPDKRRIQEILKMDLGSNERKMALMKLRNEGNYAHNVEVLRKSVGLLIVYRRSCGETSAADYLPCEHCFGFFNKKQLWRHAKTCFHSQGKLQNEKNFLRNSKCMISPFITREDEETEMLNAIINKMRETIKHPGLRDICFKDILIREFGSWLLDRLGSEDEQRKKDCDNLRTKIRALARLLNTLNEQKVFANDLSFYIKPNEFQNVVKAVKCCYRNADSPQLALTLGHYIKQVALLKASLALQNGDHCKKREANEFLELYSAHWNGKVSCVANRTKRLRTLNVKQNLPSTEDLQCLKMFVSSKLLDQCNNNWPTYPEYVSMTHVLITRIVLFNKRRIAEVSELLVSDFDKRIRGNELDANKEIVESLGASEKALMKRMELVEVRGKSTRGLRKIFILLSPDMVRGLTHLLATRRFAGIPTENKYVFSRYTDQPQDGCEAVRKMTELCPDLVNPELIRSTKLRKYLATTTQVMDMTTDELKLLADHMGHSVSMHTEIYRLQTSVLERTKVARALVALENGNLQLSGRKLSSLNLDELPEPYCVENDSDDDEAFTATTKTTTDPLASTATDLTTTTTTTQETAMHVDVHATHRSEHVQKGVKRRWSEQEERDIGVAFNLHIQQKRNPASGEIRAAKRSFDSLQNRSEATIRTKVNNIVLGKTKFRY